MEQASDIQGLEFPGEQVHQYNIVFFAGDDFCLPDGTQPGFMAENKGQAVRNSTPRALVSFRARAQRNGGMINSNCA
jgi:hypothetical protein